MNVENPEELQAILAGLDPQTRTMIAEVDLANETAEWLQSQPGRFIIGCVHQELAEAHEALARTSCWRRRRIQDLQNKIWRAESFLAWLRELLLSGHSATSALGEADE